MIQERIFGLPNLVCFSGDKPLSEALHVMNNEGVSSIVVVDSHMNVLGNISTVDVKVTNTVSTPMPIDF